MPKKATIPLMMAVSMLPMPLIMAMMTLPMVRKMASNCRERGMSDGWSFDAIDQQEEGDAYT